jgi:two-component system alkaline phosphatase synthesis response regulator PhoP
MATILIIDDEKDIVEAIEYNLKKEGFGVSRAFDGINGLKAAKDKAPDLILLDLMLPGIPGLDLCKTLKNEPKTAAIPIIMLTAKGTETDKVVGLELGADDYVTKPFGMKELIARIKNILKRTGKKEALRKPFVKAGEIEIDADKHLVRAAGKLVELTAKEFNLLKLLVENPEKVFSREVLLDKVWGIDQSIETRTVDVHMLRLREKLGRAGKALQTLRGVGYRFSLIK